jgi:peptide/nickel transport system permease protein
VPDVIQYIIRRLMLVVVLMWIVSMVTFGIFFLIPKATGTNPAVLFAGKAPTPDTVKGVEIKFGLDKPLYEQYFAFVGGIFTGRDFDNGNDKTHCPAPCLGYSFVNDQPVWNEITSDLPVTLSLAAGASIMWLVTGTAVGVLSALKRRTIFDRAAMGLALAGVSLPIFFTGLVLLDLFSYKWGIFRDVHYVGITQNPYEWAKNLVLPWIALTFLYAALYARLTRAGMLETMGEDYIRTARAKGLTERRVIARHALRAALTPIVTIFGLDLGQLLGGAILTEYTFGLIGVGHLSIDAISRQDLPVIMGVTLFAAFFIVFANLVVDVLYAFVDPRVRYS